MIEIILFEPEIPPNTGSIARMCAAIEAPLHLIEPFPFSLEDKYLKRAGLDYWPHVNLNVWPNWDRFVEGWNGRRLVFTSARTGVGYHNFKFQEGDGLVFGPETRGCPKELLKANAERVITIPIWGKVRSLNLATAAGIVAYEALRQTGTLNTWSDSQP